MDAIFFRKMQFMFFLSASLFLLSFSPALAEEMAVTINDEGAEAKCANNEVENDLKLNFLFGEYEKFALFTVEDDVLVNENNESSKAENDDNNIKLESAESKFVATDVAKLDTVEMVDGVEKKVVITKKADPLVVKNLLKCPAKKDKPSISSEKKKNHMDEDCCPDYDEWPKINCAYSAADFNIMLAGKTAGHIKRSQIKAKK